jgi:hypothetical protein
LSGAAARTDGNHRALRSPHRRAAQSQ